MPTAWSLLTLEDSDRQFVGNEGYADQLGSRYVFDTTVPNHGLVTRGDLAVLRDRRVVLGLGWIDAVEDLVTDKNRRRCPHCRSTSIKQRKLMEPRFKCANSTCLETFEKPDEELIRVRQFAADYSRTFAPVDGIVTVTDLAPAYLKRANQHAIRELDLTDVRKMLGGSTMRGDAYWTSDGRVRPSVQGGFTERLSKHRIGQQQFREQLLQKFGSVCAFTGPQHPAALDAAHLYRYCDTPEHDTNAGLLLRRDLHSLFDRWLIAVDPTSWAIRVSPDLSGFPDLAKLEGATLQMSYALRPQPNHLAVHYDMARTGW